MIEAAPIKNASSRLFAGPWCIAFALLVFGVVFLGPFNQRIMRTRPVKTPLPVKAPLNLLVSSELAPYRVLHRHRLDSAIVEALGTEEYLNWTLEDPTEPPTSSLRFVNVFVTYDTGGNDLVPHTPDVCLLGAGYEAAQRHENVELTMDTTDPAWRNVPVRVCTFVKTAVFDKAEVTVVYTFRVNGAFAAVRERVRLLIHDPRTTHGYFSKVEVSFSGVHGGASRAETVEGARRFLNTILPLLLRDHWPDFDAAERAGASTIATPATGGTSNGT